ncbi:MAG: S8 family serine peptidase [Candidatus Delongbacteria bacterium]|nr:S8 family serine peptidase [Candidatus Delongbacteria bacterium]
MKRGFTYAFLVMGCVGTLSASTLFIKHTASADWSKLVEQLQLPGQGERALPTAVEDNPRGLDRVIRWELPSGESAAKWLALLTRQSQVEYAELPVRRQTCDWPDDGDGLYALELVEAAAAWDLSHGDPAVVIAVLDIGTDWQHEDLADNLYENPLEAEGTPGFDDDSNGLIDDIHGWDFYEGDNNPHPGNDSFYHGTHVAGTACAVTDNGLGVAALAWNTSYLPVRVGIGSTIYNGYEGIFYAAHNGADIINLSWGGDNYSAFEQDVVQDAIDQGVVLVAAAGNNGNSDPHYPAAYYGVVAVANVNINDVKSPSSCWGGWVDLAAPGVSIHSTMPNDNYADLSGTSMATPQVASLLGLLKSYRPGWSGAQITQQVIFTADDIDAVNPVYAGMLGSGRINAAAALGPMTVAIRLSGVELDDASGDGILDPGESVTLQATLTNYLSPISSYSCQLSCTDPFITVTAAGFNGGALGTDQTANGELQFDISAEATNGHPFQLVFTITANGGAFEVVEYRSYVILPIFGDHDNGNCRLTVTSFGALGYYDNINSQSQGSGFQYPIGSLVNSLWHGSLLVGTDADHVSDCASWNQSAPYDFNTAPGGELTLTTNGDLQESTAVYNDAEGEQPLSLEIRQHVYSLSTDPVNNGVILVFNILNTGEQTLNGLYSALWMDFDALETWINDYAGYDAGLGLGYQHDENGIWVGMGLLSHEPVSFRTVDNSDWVDNGFTDPEKYQLMGEGFLVTNPDNTADWSLFQSAPPVTLQPGEQHTVAWAVLGGDDFGNLADNYLALNDYYLQSVPAAAPVEPTTILLQQNYPNPFNPTTTIEFTLPYPLDIKLEVYNVRGQRVAVLAEGNYAAGVHRLTFDGSDRGGVNSAPTAASLPSGVYIYRLTAGERVISRKMMLIR